jgi:hypothetical protein
MRVLVLCVAVTVASSAAADGLRDPTRPPALAHRASVVDEPKPVLSAVMGTAGDRIAIFNGQLVHSGGSVGTYTIQAVLEDGVRYRHAGLVQELFLPKNTTFKKLSTAPARTPAGVP